MTSVQSYSSRSVTCCLRERMMKTESLCPFSQAPPPVTSCCLSETSIIQSETSTSPPPGSPTAVRAEHPHPSSPLSPAGPLCPLTARKQNTTLNWLHSPVYPIGSTDSVCVTGPLGHAGSYDHVYRTGFIMMLHLCQPGSAPGVPVYAWFVQSGLSIIRVLWWQ